MILYYFWHLRTRKGNTKIWYTKEKSIYFFPIRVGKTNNILSNSKYDISAKSEFPNESIGSVNTMGAVWVLGGYGEGIV